MINIDLGDSSDEVETNYALLMMMKENVADIHCPICDDDRMTVYEKSLTKAGYMKVCVCCILCWPIACCLYFMDDNWGHCHKCSVCQSTLYNSDS